MKYVGTTAPKFSFGMDERKDLIGNKTLCQGDYQVVELEKYKYAKNKGIPFGKDTPKKREVIEETPFVYVGNLNF